MPAPTKNPKVLFRDLLIANWIPGNVAGTTTPDIHTGWHNPHSNAAQITLTNQTDRARGTSGYWAISSGGPVQVWDGLVFADCWASRGEGDGSPNPKAVVDDMAEEIRRIVLANFDLVDTLDYVSILDRSDLPPEDDDPLTFRVSVMIGYMWRTS